MATAKEGDVNENNNIIMNGHGNDHEVMVNGNGDASNGITSTSESDSDNESVQSAIPEGQYEVEHILDYSNDEQGEYYWVKWKDYDESDNTWEPIASLKDCFDAMWEFFQERRAISMSKASSQDINGVKRRKVSAKTKVPPDPRPYDERVQEFLKKDKRPLTEEEILSFKDRYKSIVAKEQEFKWPDAKLNKFILDGSDGILSEGDIIKLRKQLIYNEVENRFKNNKTIIKNWEKNINAITNGLPKISVVNDVDFEGPPSDFIYINDYKCSPDVVIPDDPFIGCSCHDDEADEHTHPTPSTSGKEKRKIIKSGPKDCGQDKKKCSKAHEMKIFAYDHNKRLRVGTGTPIYECNSKCKCSKECTNRVVQDGRSSLGGLELCIFRTSNGCGWGVKTLKNIKKGTYVSLYVGEIINTHEAERRGREYDENGCTYLFDLDFDVQDTCPYTVDAAKYGNVAHFMNHSCDPNLAVFAVWVNCLDINLPKLCLFALRDIPKNDELTFDYVNRANLEQQNKPSNDKIRKPCLCGSDKCRKMLF